MCSPLTAQLAGAQQMAVYLDTVDSIGTLLPAMNDLIAQQEGLNATDREELKPSRLGPHRDAMTPQGRAARPPQWDGRPLPPHYLYVQSDRKSEKR